MHFEHSQILWLAALVVPLLGLFLGWAWRRRRERVARFIHANLVEQLTLGLSAARRKAKLALLLGVVLLLFIALARPKGGYELQKTETRSLDILVAVDTSRSMLATDQTPNRLERAKLAVLDLMRLAKRDRLGLIAFSGTAFLQCPLTIDRNAFVQNVNSLTTDIIPQGGTAISEAVSEALRTFEKEEDNHKVLVLMTDGENHEAGVTDAAQKANDIGMKIFTIGLGSAEGELIQLPDPQTGRLEFLKDESGNVVKSRLNEPLLRELSADTGAFYLPLQGADTMERLYEAGLAGLTPNRIENQMTKRYIERYQWPLGLAILLLLGEMLLGEGRRQSHKNRATALAALGLLMLAPATLATPADARRAMEQDDFGKALRLYEEQLEANRLAKRQSGLEDARLHYNAGTAAYRAGDFEKARNHFNSTLASPEAPLPLQQRAFYNLGNAMFRLGETTDNPDDKAKQWIDALAKYEGALKLLEDNTDDEDARFNTDVVKKRLEQLKQQQQQQQQSDDNQDKKNQEKNEQKKDPQQQKSDEQKKEEQQEQQQGNDEKQEQQQQQSGQDEQQKKEEPKQQSGSNGEDKKEQLQPSQRQEQSDAGQAQPDGKMTPEQVRQLLDTLKQQERSLIYRPSQKDRARSRRITKNW